MTSEKRIFKDYKGNIRNVDIYDATERRKVLLNKKPSLEPSLEIDIIDNWENSHIKLPEYFKFYLTHISSEMFQSSYPVNIRNLYASWYHCSDTCCKVCNDNPDYYKEDFDTDINWKPPPECKEGHVYGIRVGDYGCTFTDILVLKSYNSDLKYGNIVNSDSNNIHFDSLDIVEYLYPPPKFFSFPSHFSDGSVGFVKIML